MKVHQAVSRELFPKSEHLKRWLQDEAHIDLALWGQNKAKRVQDLWEELQQGETVLFAFPLIRTVRMVSLQIERDDHVLVELSQQMRDGRVRRRNLLPSEKLLLDEDVLVGARRCIEEELGISAPDCDLTIIKRQERKRNSISYPGIMTAYDMTHIALTLPELPDYDFSIPNQSDTDPVVSHTWGWRPRTSHVLFE